MRELWLYALAFGLMLYTTYIFMDELTACSGYYTAQGYINNCEVKK